MYGLGGDDGLGGFSGDDQLYGGDGWDNLLGWDGNDLLDGGLGNDEMIGGNGDDTFIGGQGNDYSSGNDGVDTAIFSGKFQHYRITPGTFTYIQDLHGQDGTDHVYGVEKLQFADGIYDVESGVFTFNTAQDPDTPTDPDVLTFTALDFSSYGGQDITSSGISTSNRSQVELTGNAWKKLGLEYTVSENTVLEFEFKSDAVGEIHGIGLDSDNVHSGTSHIQFFGTQDYGLDSPVLYTGNGNWQRFTLNLSELYDVGYAANYLTFVNDDDAASAGHSVFKNIKLYETEPEGETPVINFAALSLTSYSDQDSTPEQFELIDDQTLKLSGNSWKKVDIDTTITEDTRLEFEFKSSLQGEIHGIGLDTDNFHNGTSHIQFYGTQGYGQQTPDQYNGTGDWQSFSFALSDFYELGTEVHYLTFINDDDALKQAESYFRNVKIVQSSEPVIPALDLSAYSINSYSDQDKTPSQFELIDNETLKLSGNSWKKIDFDYTLTDQTVLEFEFKSGLQGEIHGIGLDTDNLHSGTSHIQFYGTQGYGQQNPESYDGSGDWQSFTLTLADFYDAGTAFNHLTFVNDDDSQAQAESYFRNIKIYEPGESISDLPQNTVDVTSAASDALTLNVNEMTSYADQDVNVVQAINPDAQSLLLEGNTWKKLALDSTTAITENTVLEFEFRSGQQGEIHAIGLDNNNGITSSDHIQFYGTQNYGLDADTLYNGSGEWQSFAFNLSDYYETGRDMSFLTFINDDDSRSEGTSEFRNVKLYEDTNGDVDSLYSAPDGYEDLFQFLEAPANGQHYAIENFNPTEGDALDISNILDDSVINQVLQDMIAFDATSNGTMVSIDPNGGGDNFQTFAEIIGQNNLDLDALYNNGNLIIA